MTDNEKEIILEMLNQLGGTNITMTNIIDVLKVMYGEDADLRAKLVEMK